MNHCQTKGEPIMKTAQKELIAKRQEIEEKLQTILYEDP